MCERDPGNPDFSDLETSELYERTETVDAAPQIATMFAGHIGHEERMVTCPKCAGSGRFRGYGDCFKCGGNGEIREPRQLMMDAPSVHRRVKAAVQRACTKAKQLLDKEAARADWKSQHEDVYTWLLQNNTHSTFAQSLDSQLRERGSLSPGQVTAVRNSIAQKVARSQARAAAAPSVVGEGFAKLVASFEKARASGLKFPTLRVQDIVFTLAGPKSKCPGAIFVKVGGNYQGKVVDGKFHKVYACTDALQDHIVDIGRDPLAAAISHGRLTGSCACCGRQLVDPESVARGIGPICATKFGW